VRAPIDIAVVAYRPGPETERLLEEIPLLTGRPHFVHVWDNTGNPKSLSAAWNDLGRAGDAPLLAFLNPDIALSPGWDEHLASCLECRPEVGAALPACVGDGSFRLVNGAEYPGSYGSPPSREEMRRLAEWAATQDGIYPYSPSDPAPFWAVMMRRADWQALEGFDERLRFYGQDHDMQRRLRERGLQTVMVLSCPAYNFGSLPTKRACQAGDIDINEEYRHIGRVLPLIADGRLTPWDRLSAEERSAVRADPKYAISKSGQ
jgi:hypothetical protein